MRALDLFCGAGGLSLGLEGAGFEVTGAVEWDFDAVQTHLLNFPNSKVLWGDIRGMNLSEFVGIDLIAGGPPCQPFSVSGKQLGQADDRDMVPEFARIVDLLKPKAFMMENVAGLASARFSEYFSNAVSKLESLGYNVKHRVLDSADYGVPQRRERVFIVGVREGRFEFPEPTHGPGRDKSWKTVRQALMEVPYDLPNTAKVVYAQNPILRKSPYAGMLLNGQGRPLNLDAPSLTIPATAGGNRTHIIDLDGVLLKYHSELIHGGASRQGIAEGCRRLTIRESARLQSFPDSFVFTGPKSRQFSQIGNAIPPPLAAAVAQSIYNSLAESTSTAVASLGVA